MTVRPANFAILDRIEQPDVERQVIGDAGIVTAYRAVSADGLSDAIAEADAAVVWHELPVTAPILRRLKNCRVLVRAGVGFDSVDLDAASELGLPVVNVPDYGTNDVADHTVMLMLAAVRRLPLYDHALREDPTGNWYAEVGGSGLRRLAGTRVGIVGFGRIGSAVAHRLRAFGCDVAFYDPYLPDGVEKSWQLTRLRTLEELFASAQLVSVHVPLTAETADLVNERCLSYAADGQILVNTARGGVVDLDAVHAALRSGRLGGFAADVLSQEPPERSHPLLAAYAADEPWQRGRIVLTPHCAFYSDECERELRVKAATVMLDAWSGRPLRNCVNAATLLSPRAPVAGLTGRP